VKLSQRVLGDPAAMKTLEAIVHPLVRKAEQHFLEAAAENGAKIALLDIPLLFETGGEARVNAVVVVTAPHEVQRKRVLERSGMTESKLEAILAKQMPDADKRRRADFIVDSGHGLDHARRQVRQILRQILARIATMPPPESKS
jgi:dephospho-CoA kinase